MKELLEIDNNTGEILLPNIDNESVTAIKQTKIKALSLLQPSDFVQINGTWEAKRDGLIKILSSLPISYAWEIKQRVVNYDYASISGTLTITTNDITRQADSIGICEMQELKGSKSLHFLVTRAETRALKRSIEVLFGSVINYFVVHRILKSVD